MRMEFGSDSNAVHVRVWYSNEPHAKVSYRTKDIPALVEELSKHLPATNLNFWQAYQAMKRGEWVGNDAYCSNTHGSYVCIEHVEGEGEQFVWYANGERRTIRMSPADMKIENWYIIPKVPRYKVGDRFEISGYDFKQIASIIGAEHCGESSVYAIEVRRENDEFLRFQAVHEQWFDGCIKLPS